MAVSRIKRRTIYALLSVASIPLCILGVYGIVSTTDAIQQLAIAGARDRILSHARKLETLLSGVENDLHYLARLPEVVDLGAEPSDASLSDLGSRFVLFTQNKPLFTSLRYVSPSGDELVRANHDGFRSWLEPPENLQNRAKHRFFQAAMNRPGFVNVTASDRSAGDAREPVVRFAVRVLDRSGEPRGVLAADVFLRELLRRTEPSNAHYIALRHLSGLPLVPAPPSVPASSHLPLYTSRARASLETVESSVVLPEQDVFVAWATFRPGGDRPPVWVVEETLPRETVYASIARFRQVFVGLVALSVVAALALSFGLARRIVGPLSRVRDGARSLASGDLTHRLRVETGDEIQDVAEEFNRMGDALQQSVALLKEREAHKSERLEAVSQQLSESERLAVIGRLASGVAHEINNPAGIVSMFVEQLEERTDLPDPVRQKLEMIQRHIDRIGRVTRGLLDFARERRLALAPVDLDEVIDAAAASVGPLLEESGVRVRHDALPERGRPSLKGDGEQLQQVFEDLLINAVQAMGAGTITIAVVVSDGVIEATVSDDGPGIGEADLERVFEPFFTTKEVGEGTGLGLAVSYGVVRAHGGSMRVENRASGGAAFTVTLPVEVASPARGVEAL